MPYLDRKTAGAWVRLPPTVRAKLDEIVAADGEDSTLSGVILAMIQLGLHAYAAAAAQEERHRPVDPAE